MKNIRFKREYMTPMVWSVVIRCDMTFEANDEDEAFDIASGLGNKKELLAKILSDREKFGVDIDIDFDDACLCEMEEVF